MGDETKEKFKAFMDLVISILLDAAIVVIVAAITEGVKFALENWIYHSKIETIDNKSVKIIYTVSKYFLIAAFSIYAATDILKELVKSFKKIFKKG